MGIGSRGNQGQGWRDVLPATTIEHGVLPRPIDDEDARAPQWLAATLILLVLALATAWLLLGFLL